MSIIAPKKKELIVPGRKRQPVQDTEYPNEVKAWGSLVAWFRFNDLTPDQVKQWVKTAMKNKETYDGTNKEENNTENKKENS